MGGSVTGSVRIGRVGDMVVSWGGSGRTLEGRSGWKLGTVSTRLKEGSEGGEEGRVGP